ncbi:MAG: alkaline phytoceramidase [Rhodospirillaceae bacterium]|jgi:hypothetical protein|nr:alkaline phytoceramidase [Rhodospirillaceae bacterium]MBT5049378.1 alkaline phytoceramidase [Rhodospirillaceae bacterium]MBT5455216.1 alkaline phytoceramidase [Rhodospirillaceae bacterium]
MPFAQRVWSLVGITVIAIAATLFVPAIPQDPAYHLFADARPFLGIPNFGNVASNVAFTLVGFFGLMVLYGQTPGSAGVTLSDTLPYAIFFAGVALIGAGSAYYHWAPTNATLFWDRFPMTIAFMALTAAIVADRIHRAIGLKIILPLLLAMGVASLIFWVLTEAAGTGDLRFYGLVQFLPIFLIPIICWLFPRARYTKGRYIAAMIFFYALAKLFEHFDSQLYDLAGNLVSGHTLKHLTAAMATACVIPMWRAGAAPRPDS